MPRVFIANRGEIAVRIIRACRKLDMECVVPFSEADRGSLPTKLADRAVCVGPPRSRDSYLNQSALVAAAIATGCEAVHPGYGFLAESPEFASRCLENDLVFIGPSPETLRLTGDKSAARAAAMRAGLPVLSGSEPLTSHEQIDVEKIEWPILLKAAGGGGGKGIRLVTAPDDLVESFEVGSREAEAAFGDGRLYVERYIPNARHLEVQVIADRHGAVRHLGERECSLQRRHQKILEEAPALIPPATRSRLTEYGLQLASYLEYVNAGTVEFIYDDSKDDLWFIEMNPRLQVEHGVTEAIYGFDIVAQQIRIALGEPLQFDQSDVIPLGHAIEWRMTAESFTNGFLPQPGVIKSWAPPELPGLRIDTHCYRGYSVPPFYDSLLAKIIAHGQDRDEAIARLRRATARFAVDGLPTTLSLCGLILDDPRFREGGISATWLDASLGDLVLRSASDGT